MYRFYLALRYLLSRPINLLGMLGVAVSVAALIVVVSIFSGFLMEVEKHVQSVTSDLTVLGCERLADVERVLDNDDNVAAFAPRVVWFGLLHPQGTRPQPTDQLDTPLISMFGIDPARERQVTDIDAWLDAVTDPELRAPRPALPPAAAPDQPASMLVSERRMRSQGLLPGTEVKVTSARLTTGNDHSPLDLLPGAFTVQGAYATRHTAFDARSCFVHIDTLRGMMGPGAEPDAVTQVAIRCVDPSLRHETALRLERELNQARPFAPRVLVRAWDDLEAHFLSAVDHQRSLMKLVMIVILVVAAFLMYATLSMMVTEKTFDIGILTAMGATRLGVMQVFLSCGLAITLAGTLLGIVLGCAGSVYLDGFNKWLRATFELDLFPTRIYNLDRVPHYLDPLWIAQVAAMALTVGLLVSGLPAWRAARHDPLHSLRHE